MIDSIKQKLEKLNLRKPTSYKKAGVFVGILHFDDYKNDPELIRFPLIQARQAFLEVSGRMAIKIYTIRH